MTAAALEVLGLVSGYGDTRIIDDISFHVAAGARLAVLGRNGAGKTTLLATLVGLARRHAGRITVDDTDISSLATSARARIGVGYVPQTRDIFPSLTVEENLFVGLKGRSRAAIDEAYQLFPRLRERRDNFAHRLSGGEQQMLSTARAILGRPMLLLLDEPLEGLAPKTCDELMASLSALAADRSMTIVLVEQQIERATDFADNVLLLERGRVAWFGSARELRARPELVDRHVGVAL
jgi:branched-chain amino acid transport system ATP-binding protein